MRAVQRAELGGADPLAHQQAGIAVVGRQDVHHADGIHGLEHLGADDFGGLPGRGDHQVDGFDGPLVRVDLVAVVDLAVADQHRGPGVDGHSSNLSQRAERSPSVRRPSAGARTARDRRSAARFARRSFPSTSSADLAGCPAPGSGAGRCGAGGMWRKGAGPVSAGIGWSISGCVMSLNTFRSINCGSTRMSAGLFIGPAGIPADCSACGGLYRAVAAGPVRHQRHQLPAVRHPRLTGGETRIFGQLGHARKPLRRNASRRRSGSR